MTTTTKNKKLKDLCQIKHDDHRITLKTKIITSNLVKRNINKVKCAKWEWHLQSSHWKAEFVLLDVGSYWEHFKWRSPSTFVRPLQDLRGSPPEGLCQTPAHEPCAPLSGPTITKTQPGRRGMWTGNQQPVLRQSAAMATRTELVAAEQSRFSWGPGSAGVCVCASETHSPRGTHIHIFPREIYRMQDTHTYINTRKKEKPIPPYSSRGRHCCSI